MGIEEKRMETARLIFRTLDTSHLDKEARASAILEKYENSPEVGAKWARHVLGNLMDISTNGDWRINAERIIQDLEVRCKKGTGEGNGTAIGNSEDVRVSEGNSARHPQNKLASPYVPPKSPALECTCSERQKIIGHAIDCPVVQSQRISYCELEHEKETEPEEKPATEEENELLSELGYGYSEYPVEKCLKMLRSYVQREVEKAKIKPMKDRSGTIWIDANNDMAEMMWEEYAQGNPDSMDKTAKDVRFFLLNIAEKAKSQPLSPSDLARACEEEANRLMLLQNEEETQKLRWALRDIARLLRERGEK